MRSMKFAAALAAGALSIAGAAGGARAQSISASAASGSVGRAMDHVFGPGQWRQTSGYRTPAEEDALRRQGAGTVPAGHLSHHSMGGPNAPGAYDLVVDGVPASVAAARLKRSGAPFTRVVAEGAHGGQGPHLHVEPVAGAPAEPAPEVTVYERIVGGRRNPLIGEAPLAGGAR